MNDTNNQIQSMTHEFPAAATPNVTIFPGGFLDPGYAANKDIWFASGTIKTISINSDTTPILAILVYDCLDANNMVLKTGSTAQTHSLLMSTNVSCTGKRNDLTGTAVYDLVETSDIAALTASALRWEQNAYKIQPTLTSSSEPMTWDLNLRLPHGMAIKVQGNANLDAAQTISITYTVDVGAPHRQRISTAQNFPIHGQ